jgi:protein-disulfide isomerase
MKSLSLLASAALIFSLSACSSAAQSGSTKKLSNQVDSLSKELATLKADFDVLKYGLEKRGISIDEIRIEMEQANKIWDIPDAESPVFGNTKNPKLTIVEFTEFQCPYCSNVAPVIEGLMKKYPNDIKFVYKHFPLSFHANAPAAAAASIAAQNQGKFWEFRYALAPHFRDLTQETFEKVAKEIGLDMEKFKKDMVLDSAKQKRINEEFQLGVKVGVQGTPNFYINGKRQDRFSVELVEKMLQEKK